MTSGALIDLADVYLSGGNVVIVGASQEDADRVLQVAALQADAERAGFDWDELVVWGRQYQDPFEQIQTRVLLAQRYGRDSATVLMGDLVDAAQTVAAALTAHGDACAQAAVSWPALFAEMAVIIEVDQSRVRRRHAAWARTAGKPRSRMRRGRRR